MVDFYSVCHAMALEFRVFLRACVYACPRERFRTSELIVAAWNVFILVIVNDHC